MPNLNICWEVRFGLISGSTWSTLLMWWRPFLTAASQYVFMFVFTSWCLSRGIILVVKGRMSIKRSVKSVSPCLMEPLTHFKRLHGETFSIQWLVKRCVRGFYTMTKLASWENIDLHGVMWHNGSFTQNVAKALKAIVSNAVKPAVSAAQTASCVNGP